MSAGARDEGTYGTKKEGCPASFYDSSSRKRSSAPSLPPVWSAGQIQTGSQDLQMRRNNEDGMGGYRGGREEGRRYLWVHLDRYVGRRTEGTGLLGFGSVQGRDPGSVHSPLVLPLPFVLCPSAAAASLLIQLDLRTDVRGRY